MAYAGNKITLGEGSFVWEKFTDAVVVDDDGNVANQFPGFPLQGRYEIDGQIVQMNTAAGDSLDKMYLQESSGQRYLLTEDELAAWEQSGKRDDCALRLISKSER